jgi:hypothetical protein
MTIAGEDPPVLKTMCCFVAMPSRENEWPRNGKPLRRRHFGA